MQAARWIHQCITAMACSCVRWRYSTRGASFPSTSSSSRYLIICRNSSQSSQNHLKHLTRPSLSLVQQICTPASCFQRLSLRSPELKVKAKATQHLHRKHSLQPRVVYSQSFRLRLQARSKVSRLMKAPSSTMVRQTQRTQADMAKSLCKS